MEPVDGWKVLFEARPNFETFEDCTSTATAPGDSSISPSTFFLLNTTNKNRKNRSSRVRVICAL